MAFYSRPQRSSYRGRYPTSPGRGSAPFRPTVFAEPGPVFKEDEWNGVGGLIKTLSVPASAAAGDVAITDFKTVASYSWKESEEPTILVPGGYQ